MFNLDKLKAILVAIFSAVFGSGSTVIGYEMCRANSEPTKSCTKAE